MSTKNDVEDRVESTRGCPVSTVCEVCTNLKDVAGQSCSYVRKNPWAGVGAGAVVGLVIGFLLGKK